MTMPEVADRYLHLKAMLEDRRREILDKLRSIRESGPTQTGEVRDAEEQSVADFAKDMEFALMQMKAETLKQLDEALHRLETGTYGTCEECEQPISAARLQAVPFAPRCLDCQERVEAVEAEDRPTPEMRALPALENV
jgi:DnaK suppressor protein